MARKHVRESDFSGKQMDEGDHVTIIMKYPDGRMGQVVADAHPSDDIVKLIASKGEKKARPGRKKKTEATGKVLPLRPAAAAGMAN